ncbi:FKBP-type peptidyl-prolyl cis-trans isomerase [Paraglaciecola marina]|uniref:FKBP-type peptidyl-prolyl cis-trans isomerase n=1 Tax=Paraglaciecola marina TaxID=2500157 RepID=UPI0010601FA2|nr:FKBP-type peptidyl-prolyl cis-trans isomerase [Paraglaciecola marina]
MQITKGTVVQFLYRIKDTEGKELESNFDQEAIAYLHGYNNMMVGVENSLESMKKGDEIEVELEAAETYGDLQPDSEQRVSIKHLMSADKKPKWKAGMTAVVNTEQGQREVTIVKVGKFMVTIDINHPYAGKTLQFELKVVDVRAATDEEIEHGHAHGVGGHHH